MTTTTPTHHTLTTAELGSYVRGLVVALLADHPQGFDTAELNTLVFCADPTLPKPFIRHHVWKLDKRDPDTFRLVKGDRIALKPELQAALTTKGKKAPKGDLLESTGQLATALIMGA